MEEVTRLLNSARLEVTDFHFLTKEVMLIETKLNEHSQHSSSMSNAVIAAFITAYARVYLWKTAMNRLQAATLYADTGIRRQQHCHLVTNSATSI